MRRITAIFIGFAFVPFVAFADDVGGGETIVIQRDAVVVEEVVSAPPPAFVELQSTAIGAGIGARIGDGSLFIDGQEHAFKVRGVSLGDLGVSLDMLRAELASERISTSISISSIALVSISSDSGNQDEDLLISTFTFASPRLRFTITNCED